MIIGNKILKATEKDEELESVRTRYKQLDFLDKLDGTVSIQGKLQTAQTGLISEIRGLPEKREKSHS